MMLWLVDFFRLSSRELYILIDDGIQDFNEKVVRVEGVENFLLFLRGYPEISQTYGGNICNSTIYDGTIP